MNDQDLDGVLNQLSPIYEPTQSGWWPPAFGWWLLLLIGILIGIVFWWQYRQRRPSLWYQEACNSAKQAMNAYRNNPSRENVLTLNGLLKQVAVNFFPRNTVAHLQGSKWCQWLDEQGQTTGFTAGSGRIFGDDLYAPTPQALQVDPDQLEKLIFNWLDTMHDQQRARLAAKPTQWQRWYRPKLAPLLNKFDKFSNNNKQPTQLSASKPDHIHKQPEKTGEDPWTG